MTLPCFTTQAIHAWINQQFCDDLEDFLETQRQLGLLDHEQ